MQVEKGNLEYTRKWSNGLVLKIHDYLQKLGLSTMNQSIGNYLEITKYKSAMEILDDSLKKRSRE